MFWYVIIWTFVNRTYLAVNSFMQVLCFNHSLFLFCTFSAHQQLLLERTAQKQRFSEDLFSLCSVQQCAVKTWKPPKETIIGFPFLFLEDKYPAKQEKKNKKQKKKLQHPGKFLNLERLLNVSNHFNSAGSVYHFNSKTKRKAKKWKNRKGEA